jgi:hypothetical protein
LINGKRVGKPVFIVCGKKPDYALPTEESEKTMTPNIKYCSPRDYYYKYAQNQK